MYCYGLAKRNLLHSVNSGVLPAGIHQSQSSIVADVVIGHIELLERVMLERLGQLQGPLVPQSSVHQGEVCQRLVHWKRFQQDAGSRLQQRVVTQSEITLCYLIISDLVSTLYVKMLTPTSDLMSSDKWLC